jgi:hypothetical protein
MDKASPSGGEDCEFESHLNQLFFSKIICYSVCTATLPSARANVGLTENLALHCQNVIAAVGGSGAGGVGSGKAFYLPQQESCCAHCRILASGATKESVMISFRHLLLLVRLSKGWAFTCLHCRKPSTRSWGNLPMKMLAGCNNKETNPESR